MQSDGENRRSFLKFAAAGASMIAGGLHAESVVARANPSSMALKVVDFHNHFVGTVYPSIAGASAPAALQPYFAQVNRNLSDPQSLLSSIETAGIAARVVNTPLEFIRSGGDDVPADMPRRINDQLAELIARNAGKLHGLATVDAYGGDAGARELQRAVKELGLRGVFVEGARGDLFLDAAQARPTLAAAAELGVPVFVHPITDPQLGKRFGRYGRAGITLNRSIINTAALIALLESGVFDELPKTRIVVTTLALGGVLLAGGFGEGRGQRSDTAELLRRHVYIDTMKLHPALIRSAVDMLGADHVLAGTDWPIFTEKSVPERLQAALASAGLSVAEQQMVAGGNTLKLLGIP
jgi:aminocarboxymuconate-semialdehyde decarboxylase